MTKRTLLVLRHSKSAYPADTADLDRPLSPRGQRDAVAAGRWLRGEGLIPDLVDCSTAERARETWDLISDQLGWAEQPGLVHYDPRLYEASPGDLLAVIRETPGEAGIVALVGHNPGSAELASALTGQRGLSFPTSAVAVIGIGGGWAGVSAGSGSLATLWTPKGGSALPAG
ncbi:MAG TPA: histidine phosphatase family protein [Streptosporangiaceae bacterium]|nr:histidine phosphatase family protein [Streptosporangiaceae bacterium]